MDFVATTLTSSFGVQGCTTISTSSVGVQGVTCLILFAPSVFCFFVKSLGALVLVVVLELAAREFDPHGQMLIIQVNVINKISKEGDGSKVLNP